MRALVEVTDAEREVVEHQVAADLSGPVAEPVFVRPKSGVTVPLSGDERAAIRKIAA